MSRDTSTSRRRFTKSVAAASLFGTTLLAGCGGSDGGGDGDGGGGDGGGGDDGGDGSGDDGGDGGNGGSKPSYDGFLDDTDNYDGVEDKTGSDTVTVMVGTDANDGAYGFDPAAMRISTGTTVQFEWTGEGAQHNVVEQDGAFESDLYEEAGVHFEHEFAETGTFKYVCEPHSSLGMRGVIEVE